MNAGEIIVTAKVFFNYENMVQDALRSVMKKALEQTVKDGLNGDHHFYITFNTNHPEVNIPEYLKEQYGDELTIVLQYEFWDLEVNDENFSVTLCFDDENENIFVPYSSVTSFVDPSVKFGLQFNPILDESSGGKILKDNKSKEKTKKSDKQSEAIKADEVSNVITLDLFRKK